MFATRLAALLLPADPRQRYLMRVWAIGAASQALYGAVQALEVRLGLVEEARSTPLLIAIAVMIVLGYALFRSGFNRRFADKGLMLPQLIAGATLCLWSYAITGPARGAVLMIIVANAVFGVFALDVRRTLWLVSCKLAGLAGVMLWCVRRAENPYPADVELVNFLFMLIALSAVSTMSMRLSHLRETLRRQKNELRDAVEQLRLVATRDELTQIHNRRHMVELMTPALTSHARSGQPVCLALLDIDLFKRINDVYGHAAGDQVLQRFAQVAQQVLRGSDLLSRWGGEEFLVLFPGTTAEQARQALQRLHERLRAEPVPALGPHERITFSAGLTEVLPGEAIETATERADQAMYQAKTTGRDRTELAAAPAPSPEAAGTSPATTAAARSLHA